MSTEAIVMFVIGALLLWGGLAAVIANYARASKRDGTSTEPEAKPPH